MNDQGVKFKDVAGPTKSSAFKKYRDMYYGDLSMGKVIKGELLYTFFSGAGGAFGLFVRSKLYPSLFPNIGKKVVFGRNVTIRQPHKIRIGNNVIIDDNAVIDAKGSDNKGIVIGDNVYIGRNTASTGDLHYLW